MGRMGVHAAAQMLERLVERVQVCPECGHQAIRCACDPASDLLDGLWLSDYSVDEVDLAEELDRELEPREVPPGEPWYIQRRATFLPDELPDEARYGG